MAKSRHSNIQTNRRPTSGQRRAKNKTQTRDRFATIVSSLEPALKRQLFVRLKQICGRGANYSDVEDAFQNTVRRLLYSREYRRVARMNEKAFPFLYMCMISALIDLLRKNGRRIKNYEAYQSFVVAQTQNRYSDTDEPEAAGETEIGNDGRAGNFLSVLNSVRFDWKNPLSYRNYLVYILRTRAGMTAAQLAAVFAITPSNVHQIVSRIKRIATNTRVAKKGSRNEKRYQYDSDSTAGPLGD